MDAGHGTGVECLHQERANPGDDDGNPAVHVPDGGTRAEVPHVIALSDFADPVRLSHRVTGEHGQELRSILLAE